MDKIEPKTAGFDPLEKANLLTDVVCRGDRRKYYRFRSAKFYSPAQVASKLTHIALKNGFHQLRISGNEPTIARDHLIKVLELIPKNLLFIHETNGILIGADNIIIRKNAYFTDIIWDYSTNLSFFSLVD